MHRDGRDGGGRRRRQLRRAVTAMPRCSSAVLWMAAAQRPALEWWPGGCSAAWNYRCSGACVVVQAGQCASVQVGGGGHAWVACQ